MAANPSASAHSEVDWVALREQLHSRGLRWTPQRRLILDVLVGTDGHVTGTDVLERVRERDPDATPSTVYRTLDVLEELGFVEHSHAPDGREEFHVLPSSTHAHLHCRGCGTTFEWSSPEVDALVTSLVRSHGFRVDVNHLTVSGLCASCSAAASG